MNTKKIKEIALKLFKAIWNVIKAIVLIIQAFIDVFYFPFRIPFMFDSRVTVGGFLKIKRENVNRLVDRNCDDVYIEYMGSSDINLDRLWGLMFLFCGNSIYYNFRTFFAILTGAIIWGYIVCSIILSIRAYILDRDFRRELKKNKI